MRWFDIGCLRLVGCCVSCCWLRAEFGGVVGFVGFCGSMDFDAVVGFVGLLIAVGNW